MDMCGSHPLQREACACVRNTTSMCVIPYASSCMDSCVLHYLIRSKPTVCFHVRTGFADGVDPDSPKAAAAGWASGGLESTSMAETVYMWRRQMNTSNAHGARPVPSVYVASDFPCEADRLGFLAQQSSGPVPSFVQASKRKTSHSDYQPGAISTTRPECTSSGSYEETDWPMWYTHASTQARSLSDTMAQIVLLSSCDGLVMGHSGFSRLALMWGDYPDGNVTHLPLHRGLARHVDDGTGAVGSFGPMAMALERSGDNLSIYTATEWKESSALLPWQGALRWWDYERQRHTKKGIDPALGAASVAA